MTIKYIYKYNIIVAVVGLMLQSIMQKKQRYVRNVYYL